MAGACIGIFYIWDFFESARHTRLLVRGWAASRDVDIVLHLYISVFEVNGNEDVGLSCQCFDGQAECFIVCITISLFFCTSFYHSLLPVCFSLLKSSCPPSIFLPLYSLFSYRISQFSFPGASEL